jgi:tetratricopeptide (TPR) repeat protein
MPKFRRTSALAALSAVVAIAAIAQSAPSRPAGGTRSSLDRGTHLAETGHCSEALPLLKKAAASSEKQLKRRAGLAGVRCSLTLDRRDDLVEYLLWLNREFPRDPDVLYISVHAYSDLSARASQDLATSAPSSSQARQLNAESLEVQGKWDAAEKEYRQILQQDPGLHGIHFRLGRLILSKPNPGPDMAERAKKEFQQELEIDPSNAGAEYVLGELARQESQWPEAVAHFSRAAKLDAGFGDAYLGLGVSLLSSKQFSEAISPLETAVKLEPQNPAAHYNLAMAYNRSGRKQDADREFAVHQKMTQKDENRQESQPETQQENPH